MYDPPARLRGIPGTIMCQLETRPTCTSNITWYCLARHARRLATWRALLTQHVDRTQMPARPATTVPFSEFVRSHRTGEAPDIGVVDRLTCRRNVPG